MPQFESAQIESVIEKIRIADWSQISDQLHQHGFATIQNVLSAQQCQTLRNSYSDESLYRKTVNMQRYRFGLGEYKYFNYPLPDLIQQIRREIYSFLVPVANAWFDVLGLGDPFPKAHEELLKQCQQHQQSKATALILKYQQEGFNTLHQDIYGDVYFPLQLVIVLNQQNEDFIGGEFVITQQNPRAQSKAMVLQPNQGDILIFTTQFKPEQGVRGYHRVNMKHGVSTVLQGERYSLGIIFHDAVS
ncbi:MAG TPA: prolyl 4-hydroxylase subunit alpha [Acinetobacter sp.]|nr:prolyl 4-hydroxylase subunit alpha [Acinetobacter sp.]